MNILFVSSNNEDFGGADLCLLRMAQEVQDAGHRVCVLMRVANRLEGVYARRAIPLVTHPFYRPTKQGGAGAVLSGLARALLSLVWLVGFIRRQRPDIVHVNDLIDVLPALAARLCGCRVVYHLRMIRGGARQRRLLGGYVGHVAHVSVCVSRAVQAAYGLRTRPPWHVARVLHDWADPAVAAALRGACPPEYAGVSRRIVMVGRLAAWKGQAVFVSAAAELRRRLGPSVGCFLVGGLSGDPAEQSHLARLVADAAAAGVRWLGERPDVPALLGWADVSVHASVAPDPFPNIVLESQLLQVATVGAASGGVPEMIEHDVSGLLVAPADVAALTDALERLLRDDALRARLAAAGRASALRRCDRATLVRDLLTVYGTLAAPAAAAPRMASAIPGREAGA